MAVGAVGLQTAIWNNNLRSMMLLALYPLVIALMVWIIAGLTGGLATGSEQVLFSWNSAVSTGNNIVFSYWPSIFAVVAAWFMIAFFFHGHMIRKLSHARPVTRQQEPELYNLLENLCISRGMTTPRLEIIETDALNAFASGIDDKSYAVTVTRGLLQALQKDELEAVLAHELTHILNRDVRLLIISVIFTGMIGFACQLFWDMIRHSLFRTRSGGRSGKKDMRVILILLAVGVVLWLGYTATLFTRFALSRRREFMADAGAVALTKNPAAMMRALQRISGHDKLPEFSPDIALMCIENSQPFFGLFATHPPIAARIEAISALSGEPAPAGAQEQNRPNPWKKPRKPE